MQTRTPTCSNPPRYVICCCVRGRLKNPPYTIEEYFDTLTRNGLVATASELRPFAHLL